MVSQPVLEPKARKTRIESVPMKIPREKNYGKLFENYPENAKKKMEYLGLSITVYYTTV